jgi:trichohyalin
MSFIPATNQDSQHLVRGILRSMLRVEDEAAEIKARSGRHSDWPVGRVRLDPVIGEDMAIALQVIQRVKQEEADEDRRSRYKTLPDKKPTSEFDPRTAIEERHRKVDEMRVKRKQLKANSALDSVARSRDTRTSTDSRLFALRSRQQELSAVDSETLRAAKEEVRQQAEEMKQIDLAARRHQAQLEEMQSIQQTRDELAKEKEERLKHIRNLHAKHLIDRVHTVLENCLWKLSLQSLRCLCEFSLDLKSKEMKFQSKQRLIAKSRAWLFWRKTTRETIAHRELQAHEDKMAHKRLSLNAAMTFEKNWKTRRVLVEWLKTAKHLRVEREAEEEALVRRRKIDKMMMFVKAQAPPPFTFPESTEEVVQTKVLHTYSQSLSIVNSMGDSTPQFISDTNSCISEESKLPEELQSVSDSNPYISEESAVPKQSVSDTNSCISKESKVPKELAKMNQREEERRRRREALEAKYKAKQDDENRRKKELELKAVEDEKQRKREVLLKRKQQEAEQKMKEELKQQQVSELKQKWDTASTHRANRLRNSALRGLVAAVHATKLKTKKAEDWHRWQVCRVRSS